MSAHLLPESVDAWRMVSARRIFAGCISLASMPRLAGFLADVTGECEYEIVFDRAAQGQAFVDLKLDGRLPLSCQRTLDRFELPVVIHQQLGLIRAESEEAALPEGFEPVLVPDDGVLRLRDLIEDELILAIPLVPMRDDDPPGDAPVWQDAEAPADEVDNPFAALAGLKTRD